jgi:hypothetical protein
MAGQEQDRYNVRVPLLAVHTRSYSCVCGSRHWEGTRLGCFHGITSVSHVRMSAFIAC